MDMARKETDETQKICGNCFCCICTNEGCECSLTDNPVDYNQPGCIDHTPESDY